MAKQPPPKVKPKAQTQAVAVRSPAGTLVPKSQSMAEMLVEDAGAGLGDMNREDFAIPRLSLLQSLSPQVNKRDEAYIDGAEPGMIFDSVSNKVYDGKQGIRLVLVSFRRTHIEWIPRKKGGGFVADHGSDASILSQCTRDPDTGATTLPNGHEIVPTLEYFAFLVHEDGGHERVLLSFTKTQQRKARQLNTMLANLTVNVPGKGVVNAPIFYRSYNFATVPESNDKGNWFGWKITPAEMLEELPEGNTLYMEARRFREAISKGAVKVAAPVSAPDNSGSADDNVPM